MFAPLQTQSLLPPRRPPFVVRPAEPPSLPQSCLPRRGSEFTLPSRFHPRCGDLPNANANGLLFPRLGTCRRSSNLRSILCEGAVPNYSFVPSAPKLIASSMPLATNAGARAHISPHVLSMDQCNDFAITGRTTRTIHHLRASQLRFLYLFADLWLNPSHVFYIGRCISHLSLIHKHCVYNTHSPVHAS
jgi:hypothetical protein